MKFFTVVLSLLFLETISIAFTSRLPSFNTYRTKLYHGNKSKLIIKGNPLAERYKTIITDTYYLREWMKKWHGKAGLNFAGHYCFVWWGCGSDCQDSGLVDVTTGIIYQGITASLGYEFKISSKLMIVNPGRVIGDCSFCKSEYWVWNEIEKKFIQLHI